MHIRQKMERADVRYVMDNVEIPVVSQYKYLGCVIDEHLELNDVVEEKATAGKKALGAWLSRCRVELGDIGVGMFRKLMTSLVESTMLYSAKIWGCNRNLEQVAIEHTKLRALRMSFGVRTLHPKASLLAEMGDLPVRWRAKLRCMLFRVRVLSSDVYCDGRLIRQVATEAVRFGRGSWLCKISVCCSKFGWQEISMKDVRGLSNTEVKEILESIAWRKTLEEWDREMEVKLKLSMLKRIINLDERSDCAGLRQRADRRMMIKLRGGRAAFQIETGRWHGVAREDRICEECGKGEVEAVEHWLLRCETWKTHREPLHDSNGARTL